MPLKLNPKEPGKYVGQDFIDALKDFPDEFAVEFDAPDVLGGSIWALRGKPDPKNGNTHYSAFFRDTLIEAYNQIHHATK